MLDSRHANTFLDLPLVVSLVAVSGNPVVTHRGVAPWVCLTIFALTLWRSHGLLDRRFMRNYLLVAVGYAAIFGGQLLLFRYVTVPGSAFFLLKVLTGGAVIWALRDTFARRYFDATFLLCATSLVFYGILLAIGPDRFPSLFSGEVLGPKVKSIGIYTVLLVNEGWRNAGMMWEPGAFQGVINLALLLTPTELLLARGNRVKLVTCVVALATTFSTTGYIVFFIILLYRVTRSSAHLVYRIPLYLVLLGAFFYAFTELNFIGAKIRDQVLTDVGYDQFAPDRYHAFLFDLYYIKKSPIVGNGLHETTRFADHPMLHGTKLGHGNGLSNFAATFGLAGCALYFGGIIRARFGNFFIDRATLAVIVGLLAVGEQFLGYPLFLGLPFLNSGLGGPLRRSLSGEFSGAVQPQRQRLRESSAGASG